MRIQAVRQVPPRVSKCRFALAAGKVGADKYREMLTSGHESAGIWWYCAALAKPPARLGRFEDSSGKLRYPRQRRGDAMAAGPNQWRADNRLVYDN
jgi:hypothetical protein